MSVPTESAAGFGFGAAQTLFDWHGASFPGSTYDVSPDAQRFLMIKPVAASDDPSAQAEIIVVLNWLEELQRLVPSER